MKLKLNKHLYILHFELTEADLYIYVRKQRGNIYIVSIYVNECLIIGKCPQVNDVKLSLAKKFKIKDLGPETFL